VVSLFTSFVKRRQFIFGAVGSTCALTCKKLEAFGRLAGAGTSDSSVHAVLAAQTASAAAGMAAGNNCSHLLSPLRIRNVVLKNRIMHTQSPPHCMQGPENFPVDAYRNHYSNMAKNAAIVTLDTHYGSYPIDYNQKGLFSHMTHMADHIWQDIPPVHNYLNRMLDDIHMEGALVRYVGNIGATASMRGPKQEQPKKSVKEIVADAKDKEAQGYDVYDLDTTDLEAVEAVRNATNLVLETRLPLAYGYAGESMDGKVKTALHLWEYEGPGSGSWQFGKDTPGITNVNHPTEDELEQAVKAARKLEGLTDILWIRDGRHEHPNGFIQDPDKPFNLYYAEAIKKAGVKVLVCPSAGFHDAAQNDQFIASGLTDMVGMATPFFADPEFVKKAFEGKLDDIVPCIQCHNCHGISQTYGPWFDTCTVNPKWATPAYKLQNIPAPTAKKKVAVVGGGVAGMKAAITAAERGHAVTLYERGSALGGLQQFTDHSQWKWTYKRFKDYLVCQVNKRGVEVLLNTKATPEMINAKGYDSVLVATGSEPMISKMEGVGGRNVLNLMSAYYNAKALGENIVVVGEGRISTEAAIGLAKDGHKVMILCPSEFLVEMECIGPHNMMNQILILENHPNINFELKTTVKSINGGTVTYTDSKGAEKTLQADSVLIWSGLKPRVDEAAKFIGSANQVLLVGDCTGKAGNVQKTQRQAYFMASQI
jgi:2,4-dienoyl-CoA reductase-like NADH-dependent reductase (Old Yellow Enzyme family)/thioredoxin reductase